MFRDSNPLNNITGGGQGELTSTLLIVDILETSMWYSQKQDPGINGLLARFITAALVIVIYSNSMSF